MRHLPQHKPSQKFTHIHTYISIPAIGIVTHLHVYAPLLLKARLKQSPEGRQGTGGTARFTRDRHIHTYQQQSHPRNAHIYTHVLALLLLKQSRTYMYMHLWYWKQGWQSSLEDRQGTRGTARFTRDIQQTYTQAAQLTLLFLPPPQGMKICCLRTHWHTYIYICRPSRWSYALCTYLSDLGWCAAGRGWVVGEERRPAAERLVFVCVKDRAKQASWEPTNGLDGLVRRCWAFIWAVSM